MTTRLSRARTTRHSRSKNIAVRSRLLTPIRDRKPLRDGASALQPLVAFAVVAAALLNPVETAVAVRALVLVVLIEARVHPRPAGGLLGIFGRHGSREYRFSGAGPSPNFALRSGGR